jgi:ribosomal protein S24E
VETKTGTMKATGEANAYESIEQAKLIEPKYIIARNIPQEKEEKAEAPAPPPKKPEKPAEKKEEPPKKSEE